MTITYSLDVSSSTLVGIHKLLLRWKGSIWKSIWPELFCWLCVYFTLSLSYRYLMSRSQQIVFEDVCLFFWSYTDYIPITFMLGFYVSAVFTRWGLIFDNLGWIDSSSLLIATYIRGTNEEARMIRRNILRYLVLVQAMVYRDISSSVKKRFPTMDHIVTAGIMTANELKEFDSIQTPHIKYWTPMQWAFLLLRKARDKNMIESDFIYVDMLEKLRQYRVNVLTLTLYDWVPIPMVYTQVVNLAVRAYFLIALLSRQYMVGDRDLPNKAPIDLYVPIMTILQFLFYIGWMKVAEVMLNPLGEDDDDFETNWIIDRNLQVGLSIVDDCYGRVPELEHDAFWEQSNPELLYTPESASRHQNPMVGSCNDPGQQEDALLLQPRKRRLMSTATAPFDPVHTRVKFDDSVDENGIIPVTNHNPTRRMSVAYTDSSSSHNHLMESLRRKFSRAAVPRRISDNNSAFSNSIEAFEKRLDERVKSGGISRDSSCNSSLADLSEFSTSKHKDDSKEPEEGKRTSGCWYVNEMPPVIEEQEQEEPSDDKRTDSSSSAATESTCIQESPRKLSVSGLASNNGSGSEKSYKDQNGGNSNSK